MLAARSSLHHVLSASSLFISNVQPGFVFPMLCLCSGEKANPKNAFLLIVIFNQMLLIPLSAALIYMTAWRSARALRCADSQNALGESDKLMGGLWYSCLQPQRVHMEPVARGKQTMTHTSCLSAIS